MTRRCSKCSHDGHNARTCPEARGVKLFGVRISDGSIRKSASMGNLIHCSNASGCADGGGASPAAEHHHGAEGGYASEELAPGTSSSRQRKKGIPWTEDEHRMFLLGLKKLGKGDWRGIAKAYVVSRSPTQVASHAQKYFIRQTNASRKKRRSSLFDIMPDESSGAQACSSIDVEPDDQECDEIPMEDTPNDRGDSNDSTGSNAPDIYAASNPPPDGIQLSCPVLFPASVAPYFPTFFPVPPPLWAGYPMCVSAEAAHEIVKPTAVHSKTTPINVEELLGMSKLSIDGARTPASGAPLPPPRTVSEIGESERQSAFHASRRSQPTVRL